MRYVFVEYNIQVLFRTVISTLIIGIIIISTIIMNAIVHDRDLPVFTKSRFQTQKFSGFKSTEMVVVCFSFFLIDF
jgi:hypothetical protein